MAFYGETDTVIYKDKRDASEMQACTATRTWQGLELPNELPPKPEEKKRGGDQGCMQNTKAQHSTELLLASSPRAGKADAKNETRATTSLLTCSPEQGLTSYRQRDAYADQMG